MNQGGRFSICKATQCRPFDPFPASASCIRNKHPLFQSPDWYRVANSSLRLGTFPIWSLESSVGCRNHRFTQTILGFFFFLFFFLISFIVVTQTYPRHPDRECNNTDRFKWEHHWPLLTRKQIFRATGHVKKVDRQWRLKPWFSCQMAMSPWPSSEMSWKRRIPHLGLL